MSTAERPMSGSCPMGEACPHPQPSNGDAWMRALKGAAWVIGLLFAVWFTVEARIDAGIAAEVQERKESDARIEQKIDRNLAEIKAELRELNRYLRDTGGDR